MYTGGPGPAFGPTACAGWLYAQTSREPTVAGAAPQCSDRPRTRPAGVPAPYPTPRRLRPPRPPANLWWGPSRLESAFDPEPWDGMSRWPLVVLISCCAQLPLVAQERAVTLAEAIRLSVRVQPGMVQAQGDVETAAAQRRSAWGD